MPIDQKSWIDDPKLLESVASRIEAEHASRMAENKTYLRMYYDRPVASVDYTRPYRELAIYERLKDSYGGNLSREVVDAAISVLCRPLSAEVLPKGADFELEQGCKQASRLIEGVFDNGNFLNVAKRAVRDGMTADIGPVKGYIDPETNEIKFERINPLELYWVNDETDNPRTLIQVSGISRDELCARYPKYKREIKDMRSWSAPMVLGVDLPGARGQDSNSVKVVEAWCRSLGDGHPGRHSITCGNLVLHDESWEHEITPVFSFKWQTDFRGYGGVSLTRIISRYDGANRRLLRMVYAGLAGAIPRIIVQADSEVDGFSDVEFEKITYEGTTPPQVVIPQTVSPEIIAQIERHYTRAYAEGGVNQNMATGSAPGRYTSAVAQREFVDIANTRLLDAQQQYQTFWSDAAKVVVMLAQQAKKTHVRVKGANYYESVSFPRLSRDKYRVSFGLSSGLSLTPAGRLQELEDLRAAGVIDVADVLRHLSLPDTQQLADRANAPRDLVMRQIGRALNEGVFEMPSSLQGDQLNSLVKIGSEEYQRAQLQGNYPPANMEILRRLIKAAQARLAPPPTPPAAPMDPLSPPGDMAAMSPMNDNGAGPVPGAPPVPQGTEQPAIEPAMPAAPPIPAA